MFLCLGVEEEKRNRTLNNFMKCILVINTLRSILLISVNVINKKFQNLENNFSFIIKV